MIVKKPVIACLVPATRRLVCSGYRLRVDLMHLTNNYDQLMIISILPLQQVPSFEASDSRQLFDFKLPFLFGLFGQLLQSLVLTGNLDPIQQCNNFSPAKFDAPIQLSFQQRCRYKFQNLVVQPTSRSLVH